MAETTDELLARMAAKYGLPSSANTPPAQPIQPVSKPQIVQPPAPQQQGIMSGIEQKLRGRAEAIDKAAGYFRGGKISGPGTPTSDSIPAEVRQTGEQIKVSTGERILSAAQDAMLSRMAMKMGFDSLDAMLEHGTGQPVGPTMKGGQRAAATGMGPETIGVRGTPFDYDEFARKQIARTMAADAAAAAANAAPSAAPQAAPAAARAGSASLAQRIASGPAWGNVGGPAPILLGSAIARGIDDGINVVRNIGKEPYRPSALVNQIPLEDGTIVGGGTPSPLMTGRGQGGGAKESPAQSVAIPGGMSRDPSRYSTPDTAQPRFGERPAAITDTLTPGKTGNAAAASYVGNQGLVDRFNQQHAGDAMTGGIRLSLDGNGRPVFSGAGTPGSGGDGRTPMDIYRSEAAIRGLDPNTFDRPRSGQVGGTITRLTDDARQARIDEARSAMEYAMAKAPSDRRGMAARADIAGKLANFEIGAAGRDFQNDQLAQQGGLRQQALDQEGRLREREMAVRNRMADVAGMEAQDRGQTNALARYATEFELGQKQLLFGLQKEYLDPATKPERRAEIGSYLSGMSGKTATGSYEPIYSTTQDMNGQVKTLSGRFNKNTGQYEPIQGANAGSPAPTFEQFSSQYRARNPGAKDTDEQIMAAYRSQFGKI